MSESDREGRAFSLFHRRSGWRDSRTRPARMRARVSREKSAATAQLVAAGEVDLEAVALPDEELRARALPTARRRRKGGELRHALWLRTPARVPDRCLDRAGSARKFIFRERGSSTANGCANLPTLLGEHGGYAQQYLFHHARTRKHPLRLKPDLSGPIDVRYDSRPVRSAKCSTQLAIFFCIFTFCHARFAHVDRDPFSRPQ